MRCLNIERMHKSSEELLYRSVYENNYSIHSTTGRKPIEILFERTISTDRRQCEEARNNNICRLKEKQPKDLFYHNKNRRPSRRYNNCKFNQRLVQNCQKDLKKK